MVPDLILERLYALLSLLFFQRNYPVLHDQMLLTGYESFASPTLILLIARLAGLLHENYLPSTAATSRFIALPRRQYPLAATSELLALL